MHKKTPLTKQNSQDLAQKSLQCIIVFRHDLISSRDIVASLRCPVTSFVWFFWRLSLFARFVQTLFASNAFKTAFCPDFFQNVGYSRRGRPVFRKAQGVLRSLTSNERPGLTYNVSFSHLKMKESSCADCNQFWSNEDLHSLTMVRITN